tara:strand:- start:2540 stop:2905 length:366 start_codon:yes stop_codon:yes gene_type:complete
MSGIGVHFALTNSAKFGDLAYQKSLPSNQSIEGDWYHNGTAIKALWSQIGPQKIIIYDAVFSQLLAVLPPFAKATGLPGPVDGFYLRLNAWERQVGSSEGGAQQLSSPNRRKRVNVMGAGF